MFCDCRCWAIIIAHVVANARVDSGVGVAVVVLAAEVVVAVAAVVVVVGLLIQSPAYVRRGNRESFCNAPEIIKMCHSTYKNNPGTRG